MDIVDPTYLVIVLVERPPTLYSVLTLVTAVVQTYYITHSAFITQYYGTLPDLI